MDLGNGDGEQETDFKEDYKPDYAFCAGGRNIIYHHGK